MPNGANATATKRVGYGLASRIADHTKHGAGVNWREGKVPQGIDKRNSRTSRQSRGTARTNANYIGSLANKGVSPAPYGAPGGKRFWKGYSAPSERQVSKSVKNVGMQTSKRYRPKPKRTRKKSG